MNSQSSKVFSSSFRVYYGKVYSSLLNQFGSRYVHEIEDAIQNAFLKALKLWSPDKLPDTMENWLYIVAKNDLLNQIKRAQKKVRSLDGGTIDNDIRSLEDLRLKTILFLSIVDEISYKSKVLFILKNIFGLHVREISESTLLSEDAIYKNVNRAKKTLLNEPIDRSFDTVFKDAQKENIFIVEEILHAVFTIGFDSFNEKVDTIVNDDLCFEALSLAKLLLDQYEMESTKNLMALFCFHLARIPAKIENKKMIPFFKQKKNLWDNDLISLGFFYLEQPHVLNKYYIEAVITSKHMTSDHYDLKHWLEIVGLYELWTQISDSPMIKLNLSFCLSKADKTSEAIRLLEEIAHLFPKNHMYYSLVKAEIMKDENPSFSKSVIKEVFMGLNQEIRKEYLLENLT